MINGLTNCLYQPDLVNSIDLNCRKRNKAVSTNRFAVVIYTCDVGYNLDDPQVDRLYCRHSEWVGPLPHCTSSHQGKWNIFNSFTIHSLFSIDHLLPSVIRWIIRLSLRLHSTIYQHIWIRCSINCILNT